MVWSGSLLPIGTPIQIWKGASNGLCGLVDMLVLDISEAMGSFFPSLYFFLIFRILPLAE